MCACVCSTLPADTLCVSLNTLCVAIRVVATDDDLDSSKWCCTRSRFSFVLDRGVCVCRKFATFRKHNICITANATSPAEGKVKRLSIVCFEFIPRFCTHTHSVRAWAMSISACTIQSRVDARVFRHFYSGFSPPLKAKCCAKLHLLNTWPNLLMICQALVTFYLFRAMKMNFPRHTRHTIAAIAIHSHIGSVHWLLHTKHFFRRTRMLMTNIIWYFRCAAYE